MCSKSVFGREDKKKKKKHVPDQHCGREKAEEDGKEFVCTQHDNKKKKERENVVVSKKQEKRLSRVGGEKKGRAKGKGIAVSKKKKRASMGMRVNGVSMRECVDVTTRTKHG